mgnify:CR=1 FL=1
MPTYSPRTWGWTEERAALFNAARVFPTHVGVDRRFRLPSPHNTGYSPRTWGWTKANARRPEGVGYSPRTWGWTA